MFSIKALHHFLKQLLSLIPIVSYPNEYIVFYLVNESVFNAMMANLQETSNNVAQRFLTPHHFEQTQAIFKPISILCQENHVIDKEAIQLKRLLLISSTLPYPCQCLWDSIDQLKGKQMSWLKDSKILFGHSMCISLINQAYKIPLEALANVLLMVYDKLDFE